MECESFPAFPNDNRSNPGASRLFAHFDRPIDAGTFTGDDVVITDADGNVVFEPGEMTVTGGGTSWQVLFNSPIQVAGTYFVTIGPDILENGRQMNQNQDFVLGEELDDQFFGEFQLDPYLLDQGNFLYDIEPWDGSLDDGGWIDPDTGDQEYGDSYDGAYYLYVNGDYYGTSGFVTVSPDGRTITFETVGSQDSKFIARFTFPPTTQFARYLEVLHNPGATSITVNVTIEANLGSDGSTLITATSSGDLTFNVNDTYLTTDDAPDTGDLALAHIVMDGLGEVTLADGSLAASDDDLSWSFDVTVAAGDTVRIMSFVTQQFSRAASLAKAQELVDLPPTWRGCPHPNRRAFSGDPSIPILALTLDPGGSRWCPVRRPVADLHRARPAHVRGSFPLDRCRCRRPAPGRPLAAHCRSHGRRPRPRQPQQHLD